jgi:hypothetical protein
MASIVFPRFHPGFILATKSPAEMGEKVPVHFGAPVEGVADAEDGLAEVISVEVGFAVVVVTGLTLEELSFVDEGVGLTLEELGLRVLLGFGAAPTTHWE